MREGQNMKKEELEERRRGEGKKRKRAVREG